MIPKLLVCTFLNDTKRDLKLENANLFHLLVHTTSLNVRLSTKEIICDEMFYHLPSRHFLPVQSQQ